MKYKIFILLLFLSCIWIIGCYTVLQHPKVSEMMIDQPSDQVNYVADCSQCHNHSFRSFTHDDNYPVPEDTYNYHNWQYYFDIPWWSEPSYYSQPAGSQGNDALPPTQKRDFQRRDESHPVAAPNEPTVPTHLSKETTPASEPVENQPASTDTQSVNRRSTETERKEKPQKNKNE